MRMPETMGGLIELLKTLSKEEVMDIALETLAFADGAKSDAETLYEIDETKDFPEMEAPKFESIQYSVKKKGGIIYCFRFINFNRFNLQNI
ncbi:hypothetical protein [Bacillus gaemokensis]|uniref:Uncharacterized protein n=1 Tax=Bacillus gaemokensis TaxID=574375 RepID=A0A073KME8_9BACI|nr:hypothetical protein [Bacillus gaemokensis]KEK23518.1 hypothetical protein BAGA_08510 [Bacillus gaemokensis]KYG27112.1 hypothetical protein AZF08_15220 [Bacillus gaemokensis]